MIQWFSQEHPASCVAACLRMVLSGFGTFVTEVEIRRRLGNPRYGLTLEEAAIKLSDSGAVAEWHDNWGLDDIRECIRGGNYPIVGIATEKLLISLFHCVLACRILFSASKINPALIANRDRLGSGNETVCVSSRNRWRGNPSQLTGGGSSLRIRKG
jgi:hypothetical protein